MSNPLISICGDSFASLDPEWPDYSWVSRIQHHLLTPVDVKIHARPGCSNFHIRQQIDRAIDLKSDYIIYLATSSIRNDLCFGRSTDNTLLDRYWNLTDDQFDSQRDLVSYSWLTMEEYPFEADQIDFLKKYFTLFYDMDVAIKQSFYMIESCLYTLENYSNCWTWSQSGFEHISFPGASLQPFNQRWRQKESKLNTWDFWQRRTRNERPYFHIIDKNVHEKIASYYATQIKNSLHII
jgi:hypothetical protein